MLRQLRPIHAQCQKATLLDRIVRTGERIRNHAGDKVNALTGT